MSARLEEAYSVDFVHKNVLTERAGIINYVTTEVVWQCLQVNKSYAEHTYNNGK